MCSSFIFTDDLKELIYIQSYKFSFKYRGLCGEPVNTPCVFFFFFPWQTRLWPQPLTKSVINFKLQFSKTNVCNCTPHLWIQTDSRVNRNKFIMKGRMSEEMKLTHGSYWLLPKQTNSFTFFLFLALCLKLFSSLCEITLIVRLFNPLRANSRVYWERLAYKGCQFVPRVWIWCTIHFLIAMRY